MLYKINLNNEIYRLKASISTYEELQALLRSRYSDRLPNNYHVEYEDSDGDLVRLQNQEDFEILAEESENLKKVNLNIKENNSEIIPQYPILEDKKEVDIPQKIDLKVKEEVKEDIKEIKECKKQKKMNRKVAHFEQFLKGWIQRFKKLLENQNTLIVMRQTRFRVKNLMRNAPKNVRQHLKKLFKGIVKAKAKLFFQANKGMRKFICNGKNNREALNKKYQGILEHSKEATEQLNDFDTTIASVINDLTNFKVEDLPESTSDSESDSSVEHCRGKRWGRFGKGMRFFVKCMKNKFQLHKKRKLICQLKKHHMKQEQLWQKLSDCHDGDRMNMRKFKKRMCKKMEWMQNPKKQEWMRKNKCGWRKWGKFMRNQSSDSDSDSLNRKQVKQMRKAFWKKMKKMKHSDSDSSSPNRKQMRKMKRAFFKKMKKMNQSDSDSSSSSDFKSQKCQNKGMMKNYWKSIKADCDTKEEFKAKKQAFKAQREGLSKPEWKAQRLAIVKSYFESHKEEKVTGENTEQMKEQAKDEICCKGQEQETPVKSSEEDIVIVDKEEPEIKKLMNMFNSNELLSSSDDDDLPNFP